MFLMSDYLVSDYNAVILFYNDIMTSSHSKIPHDASLNVLPYYFTTSITEV
jgi:hypothetical protein